MLEAIINDHYNSLLQCSYSQKLLNKIKILSNYNRIDIELIKKAIKFAKVHQWTGKKVVSPIHILLKLLTCYGLYTSTLCNCRSLYV